MRGPPEPPDPALGRAAESAPEAGTAVQTGHLDILNAVADGVYFVDRDRRITFWNRAASEISGHPAERVLGHRCPDGPLEHVDNEGRRLCQTACPLAFVLADGLARQADILLRHRDGHRVPVRVAVRPIRSPSGEITGAVETFVDATPLLAAEHRATELERLAFIDALTGLGNRRYAERQLEAYLSELDRHGRPFGVLLLDIDHFKDVNDEGGHHEGDIVLRALGRTLAGAARPEDFVARWGGDEFVLFVREVDADGLRSAGERLRRMVDSGSVRLGHRETRLTVSIGGVIARHGEPAAELLRRADEFLYLSKERGRNRVSVSA